MNQSTRKHKCEEEPCMCPPGLLILKDTSAVPHETSFVLVRDSDRPGSMDHNDEDMSELAFVLLSREGVEFQTSLLADEGRQTFCGRRVQEGNGFPWWRT